MSLVDDFFSRVIPAKLTEPTHVTLHLEDGSAPIKTTLVLRIDPEDDLVADFYCVEIGNTTGSGLGVGAIIRSPLGSGSLGHGPSKVIHCFFMFTFLLITNLGERREGFPALS